MKSPLMKLFASALVLPVVLAFGPAVHAQNEVKVKIETKSPAPQAPGTIAVTADPTPPAKDPNPGVEFTRLGSEIARPPVRVPLGGKTLLQVSAPLGSSGNESVLVHVYSLNNALFMNILTAKGKQVWTRRNAVRLLAPLPDNPEMMTVTMRYLEPRKRRGVLIVASTDSMHYTLAFPKGLGGKVTQQQFLTTSKAGTQSAYQFNDLDGRGFAIVKASVVSGGEIKAGDVQQYFVWNGTKFIPRAYN